MNPFAEISRVASDVRKVGDAVRAETVRKAAFVIAVSKIPTVRVVIGDAVSVLPGEQPSVVGGPSPVSSARCPAGPVRDEIDAVFGAASSWAESVAWRESNCQPGARNGSSGSAGIFQLLGHEDLLRAACPNEDPSTSWSSYDCNIRAAKYLFDAAGVGPWRL